MSDTIQLLCEGTEQVRENKMQLLIQQYEYFHSEDGESLNDTFNRFQNLLNGFIWKSIPGQRLQLKFSEVITKGMEANDCFIKKFSGLQRLHS